MNREKSTFTWRLSFLILIVGLIFTFAITLFQYCNYAYPKKMDLTKIQIADTESYAFHIDKVSSGNKQGKYALVKGWALHKGVNLIHFNTQLVLYKDSLADALVFKTAMQSRNDVTKHFDDGHKYDSSGFETKIKNSLIGDVEYKIALLYNDTKINDGARLILTNCTIQGS